MREDMLKHLLCSSVTNSCNTRQLVFDANSTLMPFENHDGNLVQLVPRQGFLLFASKPSVETPIVLVTCGVKKINEDGTLTSVGGYQLRHSLMGVIRDMREWLTFRSDSFTV